MTLVARGAALYAATAGSTARAGHARAGGRAGLAVRIEHPPVTADLEPFVVGRFLPAPAEALPARVRVARDDGGWQSAGRHAVRRGELRRPGDAGRGTARTASALLARSTPTAPRVAVATAAFAIVHGLSIADPPLARADRRRAAPTT